jgi:hypothetical protein
MRKLYLQLISFFLFFAVTGFSQVDVSETEVGFTNSDSTFISGRLSAAEIREYINSIDNKSNAGIIGGYIESIYHESIDSANVKVFIEGEQTNEIITDHGLYYFLHDHPGKLVDIEISHPDFHTFDTAFIITDEQSSIWSFQLSPKYKILLRGRVFAGKMPLKDVDVSVLFEGNKFTIRTKGCYYDDEDYWNCLYDGMFKKDLTAEDASDSIQIFLSKPGMKPLMYGMRFNEYTGEIMNFKMKYSSDLPYVPQNNLNLKLGFPFLSSDKDWFVSLSYYRLINQTSLRRFGIGVEGNMFLSTITVSHETLPGRDVANYDSSYVFGFIGPSALFWILKPEKRYFSTYAGCSFTFKTDNGRFVPQPFIGSRIFLDINKAVSFELRYAEFNSEITNYNFNLHGNASRYKVTDKFRKINFNLGIQVVF